MSGAGCDIYPINVDCVIPMSEDRQGYVRRLEESSPRLFVIGQERLEVARLSSIEDFEHCVIEDIDSLVQHIDINQCDAQQCFYFIPQEFSWGRFRISQRALQTILASHRVFAPFLDVVHAFGLKIQENHHVRTIFHNHISPNATEGYYYEICYNLHYMAKNGRNRGDPWSLRQTGVYQKSCLSTGRSTWILMQLAADTRMHLERKLKSGGVSTLNPMQFHTLILLSTARNWTEYLEHLDAQLTELDEKSCIFHTSSSNTNSNPSFSITLSDLQRLQLLRQKLLRTSVVLDQCLPVSQGLSSHSSLLSPHAHTHETLNADISSYLTIIDSCRRSIKSIILRSEGTSSLLSALLTSSHHSHLHSTTTSTNSTLLLCQNILSQTHKESATLSSIARQGREDSKILKALTLVSTLYLPASLVATAFGSGGLVQWTTERGGGEKWHMVVVKGFWIYVLVTVGLMGVTLGAARWLWGRRRF